MGHRFDRDIHDMGNAMISLGYFLEKLESDFDPRSEQGRTAIAAFKKRNVPVLERGLNTLRRERDLEKAAIRAIEREKEQREEDERRRALREMQDAYKAKFLAEHPNYVEPTF